MEKLNSDEKMIILMKLSSNDIIKVCQTNKDLYRACGDVRYNTLWYQKIKDDFSVDYKGNNAYEEYKRLFILLKTKTYLLQIRYEDDDIGKVYNFSSIEKVKAFLHIYLKKSIDNPYLGNQYKEYAINKINQLELNSVEDIGYYYVSVRESYLDST